MVLGALLVIGTAVVGYAWIKVRHNRKAATAAQQPR
jgi:hypothetical protein